MLKASSLDGNRISGTFPQPVKSHISVSFVLIKEVTNKGHHVTVFSPFPEATTVPNYTDTEFKVTFSELLRRSGK